MKGECFMRTIQGKEFNLNDILLCDIKDYDIVLLVNDMEQLSKYEKVRFTKRAPKNLPIGKIFYSKENLLKIIKGMKKIESYVELPNDAIEVTYLDGTKIIYDASEKSAILKNIEAQKEISKTSAVGNWIGENNVVVTNWFDEKECLQECAGQGDKRWGYYWNQQSPVTQLSPFT